MAICRVVTGSGLQRTGVGPARPLPPAGPFPWPDPAVAHCSHSQCPTSGLSAGNSLPYSVPSFLPVCLLPLCWPRAPRLACSPLRCGRLPRAPPVKVASPLPVLAVSRRCPAMCVPIQEEPCGQRKGRSRWDVICRKAGVGVRAWAPDIHMHISLRTLDLWALEGSGGPRMHWGEGHP